MGILPNLFFGRAKIVRGAFRHIWLVILSKLNSETRGVSFSDVAWYDLRVTKAYGIKDPYYNGLARRFKLPRS